MFTVFVTTNSIIGRYEVQFATMEVAEFFADICVEMPTCVNCAIENPAGDQVYFDHRNH